MSLMNQERRLGREPRFRAKQRDGSMFKKQGNLLKHMREEDLLKLPSLTLSKWNGTSLVSPVIVQGGAIRLPPHLRLSEQVLTAQSCSFSLELGTPECVESHSWKNCCPCKAAIQRDPLGKNTNFGHSITL